MSRSAEVKYLHSLTDMNERQWKQHMTAMSKRSAKQTDN